MAFDFQINVRKIQFTEKENFVHFMNKIGLGPILRTQGFTPCESNCHGRDSSSHFNKG